MKYPKQYYIDILVPYTNLFTPISTSDIFPNYIPVSINHLDFSEIIEEQRIQELTNKETKKLLNLSLVLYLILSPKEV